jgi:transposase
MRVKKRRDWLKAQAQAHDDWILFEQDECWFSRFAQPQVHAWAEAGAELRLVQREPASGETQKALACFGAVELENGQVHLYFSDGQPNSEHTIHHLTSLLQVARKACKRVAVVVWDHASWHKSKRVRTWVREHNLRAKSNGDVRLLTFLLPKKSPWLNSIEPRWVHAKRKVCEPDGEISPEEMQRRLCAHFETEPFVPTFNP